MHAIVATQTKRRGRRRVADPSSSFQFTPAQLPRGSTPVVDQSPCSFIARLRRPDSDKMSRFDRILALGLSLLVQLLFNAQTNLGRASASVLLFAFSAVAVAALTATETGTPCLPSHSHSSARKGACGAGKPASNVSSVRLSNETDISHDWNRSRHFEPCTEKRLLLRKEWRTLQEHEKHAYLAAVRCLQTRSAITDFEAVRTRFDDFQALHVNLTDAIHLVVRHCSITNPPMDISFLGIVSFCGPTKKH